MIGIWYFKTSQLFSEEKWTVFIKPLILLKISALNKRSVMIYFVMKEDIILQYMNMHTVCCSSLLIYTIQRAAEALPVQSGFLLWLRFTPLSSVVFHWPSLCVCAPKVWLEKEMIKHKLSTHYALWRAFNNMLHLRYNLMWTENCFFIFILLHYCFHAVRLSLLRRGGMGRSANAIHSVLVYKVDTR